MPIFNLISIYMLKRILLSLVLLLSIIACKTEKPRIEVDLFVVAQEIYTGDSIKAEAMVIKDGKVLELGSEQSLDDRYSAPRKKVFKGMYIYPGFNDAHAHFVGYARGLGRVNLMGTNSWEECLQRVQAFADANKPEFIMGRGWDQNDWEQKEFPSRTELDSMFPNTPVVLSRIDGHASLANGAALDFAQISPDTKVAGGALLMNERGLTGLLIDNAVDLIELPELDESKDKELLLKAQEYCLRVGLTSITDAGLKQREIEIMQELIEADSLKIRFNLMVSDDSASIAHYFKNGAIESPRLRVKTVKFYLDGALGSRGALLLEPYADDPTNFGLQLKPTKYFEMMADSLSHQGWQMAIHAIGDSANRIASHLFGIAYMHERNHRWRIEHAQIVHPEDLSALEELKGIPSIQPTHATSDMYWADERLGAERLAYAYSAKSFLEAGLVLPLGTDFPVENINPLYTLRSAWYRQDASAYPEEGFRSKEALSFDEAMRGMTWSGAYASFEEDKKGLLMPGYYADFVVMAQDLSKATAEELSQMEVQATAIDGEFLYGL